jgi:hypothetical protein
MHSSPRSALIAAAFLCLLVVPLSAAKGSGLADLPAWGTEPSPNAGFPRNAFASVDALSAGDAWAVGHYEAGGFNHPKTLVEHWDGAAWSTVAVPWNQESELLGVATVSSNDVWMVGGYQQGGSALIARWNGSSITETPHPNPGGFNRLYAVTAIAPNDVWAVGEFTNPISRTLALHWNGSAWAQVPTPTGDGYSHLYGVSALGPNDVWAVGDDGNSTLALHWDGSQWTRVATPSPGFSATLRAVSAATDGTVWAVGDSGSDSLTLRWNGSEWVDVPSPDPGSTFLDLNGVVSISANDAWAVGVYDVWGPWKTLTMHWDGSSWAVVESPSPDPTLNRLDGVTALSASDVWAVGHGGATGSMAIRLQGASWHRAVSANEGTGANVLNAISAHTASDIWAVGHAQTQSLTLHYDGSAWTVVPSPNLEYGVRLEDVVTLGPDDAWAVGWSGSPSSLDDTSVAMHWDGQSWTVVPTPQPGGTSVDRLLAVDALGSNDVWATGVYWDAQTDQYSVILHWNGTSWSVVPHTCDTYGGLTGVTVLSATNAWAVGNAETCHFDGTFWNEVPSPQPRPEYYELGYPLEDVSGTSANDVWAVGARIIETPYKLVWQSITEHWDGSQWTLDVNVPGQSLYGVEALSATNVWAVGTDSYGPLILHDDGSGWVTVPTPEWGRGGGLAGIDSAPDALAPSPLGGRRELWAAGNYLPGQGLSRTLIERAPSPTQGAVFGGTNVAHATVSWFGPETGSVETNDFGDYQVGGLTAGTYTFTATNPGCTPAFATVTVVAGQTLRQDFHIGCSRAALRKSRARGAPGRAPGRLLGRGTP